MTATRFHPRTLNLPGHQAARRQARFCSACNQETAYCSLKVSSDGGVQVVDAPLRVGGNKDAFLVVDGLLEISKEMTFRLEYRDCFVDRMVIEDDVG